MSVISVGGHEAEKNFQNGSVVLEINMSALQVQQYLGGAPTITRSNSRNES